MVMPHAVHGDAGGERVVLARDPFRERHTALAVGRVGREFNAVENVESTGADKIARLLRMGVSRARVTQVLNRLKDLTDGETRSA